MALADWPHGYAAIPVPELQALEVAPPTRPEFWHLPIWYALGRFVMRDEYWQWAPTDSIALREWKDRAS